MINMDLIELQKGCKATCVVIQNDNIEELESKIVLDSNCTDVELYKSFDEECKFWVIKGIDSIDANKQDRFYQIVKDREFNGKILKDEVIIVLTVEGKDKLKNILPELYNLCVVAF